VSTADKLRAGADASQGEFEDACWGVLVHAMTHQPAGELLYVSQVTAEGMFESAVLPAVRRAWERSVEALALEAMVGPGAPTDGPDEDG